MELVILHTNDIHGRYEAFARLVPLIRRIKQDEEAQGRAVVVLDSGDFMDFTRVDLLGTEGREGVGLLRAAGYDALAVGNNEGFQGIRLLSQAAGFGQSQGLALLSCNLRALNGPELAPIPNVSRSIVLDRQDLRILVMGVTPEFNDFFQLMQMRALPASEAVQAELEAQASAVDCVILLSHLGQPADLELAARHSRISVVIGGHTHDAVPAAELPSHAIYAQAGQFAERLGYTVLAQAEDGWKLVEGKLIPCEGNEPDPHTMQVIADSYAEARVSLGTSLCIIPASLWHDVIEENPLSTLCADALKDLCQTQLGLVNSGLFASGIVAGPLSRMKLIDVCPSPLNPTIVDIRGEYLLAALSATLDPAMCLADGKGAGFRGKYAGRLHLSGAVVYWQQDGRGSRTVSHVLMDNGEQLAPAATYRVATTDYLQRGSAYSWLGSCRLVAYRPELMREVMESCLSRRDLVDAAFRSRWVQVNQT
jgi:5'-nucleotidase